MLIKSITGLRKPNIAGYKKVDDLGFKSPGDFRNCNNYIFQMNEGVQTYEPENLSFKTGFIVELDQDDDVVLLNGPSGCGKTTFLRALVNSIQGKMPEPISHTFFNEQYGKGFIEKYASSIDVCGISYDADTRNKDQLIASLKKYPELNSNKKVENFITELQNTIGKSFEECLKLSVFAYEAGPWLMNSGIALTPFKVKYFKEKPNAWYYCKELSPFLDGSSGQNNYNGIEMFFDASGNNCVLCLDDPETSLDKIKKNRLFDKITSYDGQIFIASHDLDFKDISKRVIDFNKFK